MQRVKPWQRHRWIKHAKRDHAGALWPRHFGSPNRAPGLIHLCRARTIARGRARGAVSLSRRISRRYRWKTRDRSSRKNKIGGSPFGPRPPHAGPSPRCRCAWRAVTHWLALSHVYVSLHVYVTAFVRIYRCTHDTQASISQCRTTRRACSATEREEKIGIRGGDNPIEIPRRARPGRMLNGIPRAAGSARGDRCQLISRRYQRITAGSLDYQRSSRGDQEHDEDASDSVQR